MQAKLDAAVARLEQARDGPRRRPEEDRRPAEDARPDRRAELPERRPVADGPVDGAHLAGPRRAHRPAELRAERPRQGVGHRSTGSRPPVPCSPCRSRRSRTPRSRWPRSARPPPRTCCASRALEAQAEAAEQQVASLVVAARRRPAGGRQGQAGRPGPAARPAEGAQPDRRDPQEARRRGSAPGRGRRPPGRPGQRPDPVRQRPDALQRLPGLPGGRARSPRRSAGAPTRSTATARCTTASTSAPPAAPRSTPPPRARCIEKYFQTAWGNRVIIDHGFHHGVGLATITNHMVGSGHRERRPARRPRPDRRVRRHDRLVHRLPPALHGAPERLAGRPDELVLTRALARTCENRAMVKQEGHKLVAQNKKARHDYLIEDTYEAGMVLQGTEVKSLRAGRASLVDGFVEIDDHEAWLHGVHIPEYTQGTWTNHPARRKRKLLLNRAEIDKIERRVNERGLTIVPLSLYFKDGRAKVEIALAKGKKTYDKRHALAERQANREAEQALGPPAQGPQRWLSRSPTSTSPAGGTRARDPGPVRRARALPAAADHAQGPRAVRQRRPADRPAVAAGVPRRRRRAGRAAARPRRTPLLLAALRAPAGHRGVPQRVVRAVRRRHPRVPVRRRPSTPSRAPGRTSPSCVAAGTRGLQGARPGRRLRPRSTRCSTTPGARSRTPARRSSCTPSGGPVGNDHTGPGPMRALMERHPTLTAVIAHLGAPEYAELPRGRRGLRAGAPRHHDGVHRLLRGDGGVPARPAAAAGATSQDRVLLGSDFPNIPYPYAHQLESLERLDLGDDWLRAVCWDNGHRLFTGGDARK